MVNPLIRKYPKRINTPQPNKSAGILDDFAVRSNVATKTGTVLKVPVDDIDIPNKKYVDDSISAVDLTGLVPYTGATGDVDLGTNKLLFDGTTEIYNNNPLGYINILTLVGEDGINLVSGDWVMTWQEGQGFQSVNTPNFGASGQPFGTGFLNTLDLGTNTIVDADVGNWDAHLVDMTNPHSVTEETGVIKGFGGAYASLPSGYLLCDGTAISRTTFATLFAVTGTKFGVGDGTTTFNLPNLQSKFARGAPTATEAGGIGGTTTHSHTTASHTHGDTITTTSCVSTGESGMIEVDCGLDNKFVAEYFCCSDDTYHKHSIGGGVSTKAAVATSLCGTIPPYQNIIWMIKT